MCSQFSKVHFPKRGMRLSLTLILSAISTKSNNTSKKHRKQSIFVFEVSYVLLYHRFGQTSWYKVYYTMMFFRRICLFCLSSGGIDEEIRHM